MLINQAGMERS